MTDPDGGGREAGRYAERGGGREGGVQKLERSEDGREGGRERL